MFVVVAAGGAALFAAGLLLHHLPGGRSRPAHQFLLLSLASFLFALVELLLLGAPVQGAVFLASIAALAVTILACVTPARWGFRTILPTLAGVLVLVIVPSSLAVFDTAGGWLSEAIGVMDFSGGFTLAAAVGASSVALAEYSRGSADVGDRHDEDRERSGRPIALPAVLSLAGIVGLVVGAEFASDDATPILAVNAILACSVGAIGWVAADVASRPKALPAPGLRTTELGVAAVSGMMTGGIAILATAPWLEPGWAALIAGLSGALGAVIRRAALPRWGDRAARIIGTTVGAVPFGLVFPGLVAKSWGYINSGQLDLLVSQLEGVAIVFIYSLAVSSALARISFPRCAPTVEAPA